MQTAKVQWIGEQKFVATSPSGHALAMDSDRSSNTGPGPMELLLMALDLAGVACSAGSACSSGSLLPSPVLRAMGLPEEGLRSAVRFSLGYLLDEDEIDIAAERVAAAVCRLRQEI